MSRQIDASNLDVLSDAELGYLFARSQITEEQLRERGVDPSQVVSSEIPLQFLVHTGDANTKGVTQQDIDKLNKHDAENEDDLGPDEASLTEPQLEGQSLPEPLSFDDDDDAVVDESDDYRNWTNEQLRTELATRGLDVSGKKEELAARLEENDAAEGVVE